jgi:hypothetical protein
LLGNRRDATHEGAADAEDMNVFWFAHHQFLRPEIKYTAPIIAARLTDKSGLQAEKLRFLRAPF